MSDPPTGLRPTGVIEDVTGLVDEVDQPTNTLWGDVWRKLKRDKQFWVAIVLIAWFVGMSIAPQLFFTKPLGPENCNLIDSAKTPTAQHWFGTDLLGCDYYTRVVYGTRTSMEVGVIVASATLLIALVLGGAAGYFGGGVDMVISRIADIFFCIPTLLGSILLLSLFGKGGVLVVSLVLVFFGWPDLTRLVRSTVISGRRRGYVRAAETVGASGGRTLRRHVLPNGIAPALVFTAYIVGGAVAGEATLTFLGVGLRLPSISWGLQISVAQTRFTQAPYLLFFPSLFLCLFIAAFVLLGESFRDAMDVKLSDA
jgi:ABC-type dipeptide/oligopeptide/nickel transport system permease subunit